MTSSKEFIDTINSTIGNVSFATFIVMLLGNKANIDYSWKSLLVLTVILDCIAFGISYFGILLSDNLNVSTKKIFCLMADCIWAWKDACKYSYIASRGEFMYNRKNKWISTTVFCVSLALYYIYIYVTYSVKIDESILSVGFVSFNWSVVALYTFWLLVDVISGYCIMVKFEEALHTNRKLNQDVLMLHNVIHKQQLRLVGICLLMATVTVLSICNTVWGLDLPNIGAIIFVYCQLVLVMNEFKPSRESLKADCINCRGKDKTANALVADG
ncbi:hypothetical protein BC833DRAFT_589157 [Globomyces pollinis-pini]|nr:hypothetical protein BC833DRAFT_589157 [Globomyces pollinis-pini]KAJ2998067.1 hypothetical protein HDV02_004892 [Globomyces sp. JEL0801]